MDKNCDIIQDILPLYVDGVCSKASSEMVSEHLAVCEACKNTYKTLCSHIGEEALRIETDSVIVRHEKRESLKIVKSFFFALIAAYLPALFIIASFTETDGTFITLPYSFVILVFFLYTFPFYVVFTKILFWIVGFLEKRRFTFGQKIFRIIELVLSVGIILTAIDIEDMMYSALTLSAALIICSAISAIIYKYKPNIKSILCQKTFWIFLLALIVCITMVFGIEYALRDSGNLRDDEIVREISIKVLESGSDIDGVYFNFETGDGIICNFGGNEPYVIADLVNDTANEVEYDVKCYVYKKVYGDYGLCSTDYITFPDDIYTLPANASVTQKYSVLGYDIDDTEFGIYKFVTFIDEKAVWFEFEIDITY